LAQSSDSHGRTRKSKKGGSCNGEGPIGRGAQTEQRHKSRQTECAGCVSGTGLTELGSDRSRRVHGAYPGLGSWDLHRPRAALTARHRPSVLRFTHPTFCPSRRTAVGQPSPPLRTFPLASTCVASKTWLSFGCRPSAVAPHLLDFCCRFAYTSSA
jgi:hypothetical protein